MTHPNSLDLEAFACGEEIAGMDAHVDGCAECRAFVEGLRGLPAPKAIDASAIAGLARRERNKSLFNVTSLVFPLAAAAVLLLLLRRPAEETPVTPTVAVAPPSVEPTTSFKGSRLVAVIRERDGVQQRFTGKVPVREGDRLRVEVAIDREQAILAAVVSDDGSTLEVMPGAVRAPGTHYSEKSARVSGPPMSGKIVVGPTMQDATTEIRIEWETRR